MPPIIRSGGIIKKASFLFHYCILQVDKLEVKYSLPGRDGTEISVIQDKKCIQSEIFVHISLLYSTGRQTRSEVLSPGS